MKKVVVIILVYISGYCSYAQSFEVMPGIERLFIDAQYLKFFDDDNRLSLFSRARATAAYTEQNTNLFTGTYLNYTTKSGLGGTVNGRIASSSSGIDVMLLNVP